MHILNPLNYTRGNPLTSISPQDYEDFDIANEDDTLEEFLGIPRKTPKSVPAGEATEGPDVGKLPGDSQPPAGGEGTEQPPAEPMEVEKSV